MPSRKSFCVTVTRGEMHPLPNRRSPNNSIARCRSRFLLFGLQPELSASRGDVVALFTAQSGSDTVLLQDREKLLLPGTRRPRPLKSFDAVVRDQINFR